MSLKTHRLKGCYCAKICCLWELKLADTPNSYSASVASRIQKFRYWTMCSHGKITHLFRWVNATYQFEQLVDANWQQSKADYWSIAYDYGDLIPAKDAQKIEQAFLKGEEVPCGCTHGRGCSPAMRTEVSEVPPRPSTSTSSQAVEDVQNYEPFGDLDTHAIALHEFFLSLLRGGFTEQQALRLIGNMFVHHDTK